MTVPQVALFYRFTPLPDPKAIRLWQTELCRRLGLTGRILISAHGINGTVGGDPRSIKAYVEQTLSYPPFVGTDVKISNGTGADFPRLSVRVRPEIVTFGAADEVVVDVGGVVSGVVSGGTPLTPEQLHALLDDRGSEVVLLDARNAFEAQIGRFEGAVVADVDTTKDFIAQLDSGAYDDLKGRPVVTYCTGGVRCEVLSALMINRGFGEVYQLAGGIVRYGERYGDDGLWQGSLYVFDGRNKIDFSDHTAVLGRCDRCGEPTADFRDCVADVHDDHGRPAGRCKERALLCDPCSTPPWCSDHAAA